MTRGKKVTKQVLSGEAGMALIRQRVIEMGHLFHERRMDHGIDAEIEIVDPVTRETLNLVVMVQSKASRTPFPHETATSFQYTCDEIDLNYWLSGNAPVILVLSHPDKGEAWWVDIKAEFSDARRRATRTVTVDKRRQVFDASAGELLARVALPKSSGLHLSSPPKRETLTSNLLRIRSMPESIYVAPALVNTYPAAGELLSGQGVRGRGDWILHDGLIISFSDLSQSPLKVLCDGSVEQHNTAEWAASDDIDIKHRFMDLLSRALGADNDRDLRWHKSRKHLHFLATPTLTARKEGQVMGKGGRTVFGEYRSKKTGKIVCYRHAALRARFRRFDGVWYCQIDPDYCFTSDGWEEYRYADAMLAGIKRLDRHKAVASWTRTWATFLMQPQPDLFSPDRLLAFGGLAAFEVDRGIDDRLWGPAPSDDEEDDASQARVDAALATIGLDVDELLALDDEAEDEEQPLPPAPTPVPHPAARAERSRKRRS
mgnify:CR=1 FL=1